MQDVFGTQNTHKWIKYLISIKGGREPSSGPAVSKFWEMPNHLPRSWGGRAGRQQGTMLEPLGLLLQLSPHLL